MLTLLVEVSIKIRIQMVYGNSPFRQQVETIERVLAEHTDAKREHI